MDLDALGWIWMDLDGFGWIWMHWDGLGWNDTDELEFEQKINYLLRHF
jgi:hypothetical protein